MKTLIVETVSNFSKVQESIQRFQVDKKITYGRGQVILFHGDSGTVRRKKFVFFYFKKLILIF